MKNPPTNSKILFKNTISYVVEYKIEKVNHSILTKSVMVSAMSKKRIYFLLLNQFWTPSCLEFMTVFRPKNTKNNIMQLFINIFWKIPDCEFTEEFNKEK